MIYKDIPILEKDEIKLYVKSGVKDKIIDGLLSLFMNKVDKAMAIEYSNWAMESKDIEIQKTGILGIGHIARVYGLEDISIFKKNIDAISKSNEQELLGILEDAIDDFNVFKKQM